MDRRRFLLTALAVALPAPLVAQPLASRWRIGVLLVLLSPSGKEAQAFRQGLRDAGYVEGRDVVIEWRSADGDYGRLSQLAADLVERKVDVIVADTTQPDGRRSSAPRQPSLSSWRSLPIQSDPASSRIFRSQEETSPGYRSCWLSSARKGCNC
jgi:hypothetical protein